MLLARFQYIGGAWSEPFPELDSEKTLVIAFAPPSYAAEAERFAELAEAYPRAAVIGCSTADEIDGISVAVIRFEHTRVRYAHARLTSEQESYAAGGSIAGQLAAPGLRGVMVLSRGHDVNGKELIRGLDTKLDASVVRTGGLASGDTTFVIGEGKPMSDGVVAIGLYGDRVRVAQDGGISQVMGLHHETMAGTVFSEA
jgi:hypothetical protein